MIKYALKKLDKLLLRLVISIFQKNFIQEPQLTVKMSDHELWIGFLRDPDENLIGIMSEKPLDVD